MILDVDGNVDGEADLGGFISNGCTLSWGNAPAAAYLIHCIFFAGDDLTAKADTFTAHAVVDNTVDVNTVGFEPEVLLVVSPGHPFDDSTATGYTPTFGVVLNKASDEQYCWAVRSPTGVATSAISAVVSQTYGGGQMDAAAWLWAAEFGSFDSSGFSCTSRVAGAGGDEVGFLALSFAGTISIEGGIIDTPTSTGNQSVTDPGFCPQAVICGVTQMAAVDSVYTDGNAGSVGVSMFDLDDEYCVSVQTEDNQDTTDTQSLSDNTAVNLPNDDGSAGHVAAFVSFDSTGWTWNFTTTEGTAVKYFYAAFGGGAAARAMNIYRRFREQG